MQNATGTRQLLRHDGHFVTRRLDGIHVTVQRIRAGAYAVTVYQRTLRVDDLCRSWPTEQAAFTDAADITGWLRAGFTVADIVATRAAVAA
jgi:hypothetical protein